MSFSSANFISLSSPPCFSPGSASPATFFVVVVDPNKLTSCILVSAFLSEAGRGGRGLVCGRVASTVLVYRHVYVCQCSVVSRVPRHAQTDRLPVLGVLPNILHLSHDFCVHSSL